MGSLIFIGKEFLYLSHSLAHSVIIEANLNKNFIFIINRLPKKKYHKAYEKSTQQDTYNMLCVKTNIENCSAMELL